jgi:hypothetical protein
VEVIMFANRVFLAFALSGFLAAQSSGPIINLGGDCGGATLNVVASSSFLAFTMSPPSIGLLIVGFTDPAMPIPGCGPCVLHASLDLTFFMLPTPPPFLLSIPAGPIPTLYVQGVQFPGGCSSYVPGLDFNVTNAFQIT